MDNLPPIPRPSYSGEDKVLIILCHLSAFLGVPFILPLIVYLIKRNEPGPTEAHAKEVLNFHLSVFLYSLCAVPLVFIGVGFVLIPIIWLWSLILAIVAAIKASEGVFYRYPLCIRFIS